MLSSIECSNHIFSTTSRDNLFRMCTRQIDQTHGLVSFAHSLDPYMVMTVNVCRSPPTPRPTMLQRSKYIYTLFSSCFAPCLGISLLKENSGGSRLLTRCSGCEQRITDQYILHVSPDMNWHVTCLRCHECGLGLDESCTCFVRDGRTYCKGDYLRSVPARLMHLKKKIIIWLCNIIRRYQGFLHNNLWIGYLFLLLFIYLWFLDVIQLVSYIIYWDFVSPYRAIHSLLIMSVNIIENHILCDWR